MKVNCIIENKVYQIEEKMILKGVFRLIKNKYKAEGKHAIYALKRDNVYDLKRQEFTNYAKALEVVKSYRKQGYEVFWI